MILRIPHGNMASYEHGKVMDGCVTREWFGDTEQKRDEMKRNKAKKKSWKELRAASL